METRTSTSRIPLCVALIALIYVGTGCGGVTVQLGGGSPYGGYYHDDFYYDYGGYSYYDSYWYYDDYGYDYDDYYFVDYIDGWYDGCYYCKSSDDLPPALLEEPAQWDAERGPWERFVRARVGFLLAKRAQGSSEPQVPPGE